MTPEELEQVRYHARQIAQLLYADTDPAALQTLGTLETVVREKILDSVSPEIGLFLSKPQHKPEPDAPEGSKRSSGRFRSRTSKPRN